MFTENIFFVSPDGDLVRVNNVSINASHSLLCVRIKRLNFPSLDPLLSISEKLCRNDTETRLW